MRKSILLLLLLIPAMILVGCSQSENRHTGVYLLLDTSGTYALELEKANSIIRYLLGTMAPGDTLAVARPAIAALGTPGEEDS